MDPRAMLNRGRDAYARRAWRTAYEALSLADRQDPLPADALELLAVSAYLIGRADDYDSALERAHHRYLDAGERARASRCAFWLGLHRLLDGEMGGASGWLARAKRLVDGIGHECVERGYLLLPVAEGQMAAGDQATAASTAACAAEIGERFGDADLTACARHVQGRALLLSRQLAPGLALLDEVMVTVASGELSPVMSGLIYCSAIDACGRMYVLDRVGEWTSALSGWCDAQPDMVAFTGRCRVHRAEIMHLRGAWDQAIEEAGRVHTRCRGVDDRAVGAAFYQQAEVHRLRGELVQAEAAYRSASQTGREPQPGLALLRLAQGRAGAAAAALRRAVRETNDALERARLLPACVEVLIALGETDEASRASSELEAIAEAVETVVLAGFATHARGAVELANGDAQAALWSLRRAWQVWRQIEAPYLAARTRVLAGLACDALGDHDSASLEFDAARSVFAELRAAPDLARIDALGRHAAPDRRDDLTPREVEVLRLVTTGRTNRAIAAELSLSEKTVDRHVSNILTKLNVRSRAAATAYACTHKLV